MFQWLGLCTFNAGVMGLVPDQRTKMLHACMKCGSISCSGMSDSASPWTVCSSSSSFVHGILQARILEWVAIPFSRDLTDPGIKSGFPSFTVKKKKLSWNPLGNSAILTTSWLNSLFGACNKYILPFHSPQRIRKLALVSAGKWIQILFSNFNVASYCNLIFL